MAQSSSKAKLRNFKEVEALHTKDYLFTLNEMRKKGLNTDVTLVCGNKEFPAHELVLSAASSYFQKMFESDFKETFTRKIDFSHLDEHILNVIIDFIYSSSEKDIGLETLEDLLKIYSVAHLFDLDSLVEYCWELIVRQMNARNSLKIWNFISVYRNEDKEKIKFFILNNLNEVFKTEEFFNLTITELRSVLEEIRNVPSRDFVLEAIIKWAEREEDRKCFLYELLLCLNFDYISSECLDELLTSEIIICSESEVVKLFLTLQIKPKLKSKSIIEDLMKDSVTGQLQYEIPSVYFYFFGWFQKHDSNGKIKNLHHYVLRINIQTKAVDVIWLTFELNPGTACVYYDGLFYFIGGCERDEFYCRREDVRKKQFIQYEWQTKKTEHLPPLLEAVSDAQVCVVQNKIYVIGGNSFEQSSLLIQFFSRDEQFWDKIIIDVTEKVLFSVNLNGILHVYAKKQNYIFQIIGDNYEKIVSPVLNTNCNLVCVYKKKLYCFFHVSFNIFTANVYNPELNKWKSMKIFCSEEKAMEYCFSTEEGIFFYNGCYEIFKLNENECQIQKITSIEGIKSNKIYQDYHFVKSILKIVNAENLKIEVQLKIRQLF